MGKKLNIFISYRRVDSVDFSAHLHDALSEEFNVFFDKEGGIGYGADFPEAIENGIKNADVVLMVIGNKCCEEFKAKEGGSDFVVKEIALAKASNCHILPVVMDGVNMPNCFPKEIAFVANHNGYLIGRNRTSLYFGDLKEVIKAMPPKVSKTENSSFLQEVQEGIERDRLVVLFSQDFTNIDAYYQTLKEQMASKFSNEFYVVSIPSYVDDQEEYFSCIANDCNITCEVKKENDWYSAIKEKLKSNSQELLLFVTDLENGNEELDRKFATMLRNLKEKFPHFHALFVGKKELAKLVYGEGDLSPLNTATEMFFPDDGMKLGENRIVQQFQGMGKNREEVCKLLQKEKVGRFAVWSYNETINKLFWKNLLVRDGRQLVWRGALTKEIARDVLGCESN